MDNTKLLNKNRESNTRTIGTNTDLNLIDLKCFKCFQESLYSQCPIFPYYFPFPVPICNCMAYSCYQNNFTNYFNTCCKCNTKKCGNAYTPQHCLMNYSSSTSTSCRNCETKHNCMNSKTVPYDRVTHPHEITEANISRAPSECPLESENSEMYTNIANSPDTIEELANVVNSPKYAELLEKNYRNNFGLDTVKEESSTKCNNGASADKLLINYLLKPNTNIKNIVDESDDCIDSENDENISDDDFSGKTVIDITSVESEHKLTDDRRPTRVNLNSQKRSLVPNKNNPDIEMLMMIKTLINNQYENNTPELNKLLNHIGIQNTMSKENKQTNSPSSRKVSNIKNYNSTTKMNENKKI